MKLMVGLTQAISIDVPARRRNGQRHANGLEPFISQQHVWYTASAQVVFNKDKFARMPTPTTVWPSD